MANKKVIILGGGVGGMSAAHELIERGYAVEVYDRNTTYVGGKARSVNYFGDPKDPYKIPLPGEHGFRFFPGFYKHITDTMKRIPFTDDGKKSSVFNNLVSVSRVMMARGGKLAPIVTDPSFPRTLADFELLFKDLHGVDSGLTKEDISFFAERVWQLATSSKLRRDSEYERLGWWEYMQADTNRFSEVYKKLLVEGLLHTLVAAHAKTASTKTGGNTFLQLVFCMIDPTIQTDRVLDGPTNERWLTPWLTYLESKGVKYNLGHEATAINLDNNKQVSSVTVTTADGKSANITGDYYIFGCPVERMAKLVTPPVIAADQTLALIPALSQSVNWMNGIQFYLNENVIINEGHVICINSPWALTCISQVQFWKGYDITSKGNGNVKGVVSVDISEWFQDGEFNKLRADNCMPEAIKKEVWEQLKASLNVNGNVVLKDTMLVDWYIDRDICIQTTLEPLATPSNPTGKRLFFLPVSDAGGATVLEQNIEPLLVNNANTWGLRPNADCQISNLFFASDYVRTNTDLATMEGANEAARRAVNCILDIDQSSAGRCEIWPLSEPLLFAPLKWYDEHRWNKGLPWTKEIPFWLKAIMVPWGLIWLVEGFFKLLYVKIFGK